MKRDPEVTKRNALEKELSLKLKDLQPRVLTETGIADQFSLHGKIGHKNEHFLDVKNEVIYSADQFVELWITGLLKYIENLHPAFRNEGNAYYQLYRLMKDVEVFRDYVYLFLKRTYVRNFKAYSKVRPTIEEAEIWIGQNTASYGLLVTPRFNGEDWENDKSEIRHFKKPYWSIGHILETGLVVPKKNARRKFTSIEDYLDFFLNVMVRFSGSDHEYAIAEMYCEFVRGSNNPEGIPLLIPEFRYGGKEKKHEHRLDFMIVGSKELNRIGFELSPWSTHGQLSGTAKKLKLK